MGPPPPQANTTDPCQGVEDDSGYLDTVPYWFTPIDAGDGSYVQGYPTTLPGVKATHERPTWLFSLTEVISQLAEKVAQIKGHFRGWPACFFGHPGDTLLIPHGQRCHMCKRGPGTFLVVRPSGKHASAESHPKYICLPCRDFGGLPCSAGTYRGTALHPQGECRCNICNRSRVLSGPGLLGDLWNLPHSPGSQLSPLHVHELFVRYGEISPTPLPWLPAPLSTSRLGTE